METQGFLERVLPENGGDYFIASVDKNNRFAQAKASSIADLLDKANRLAHNHRNVYFATGVYDGTREADRAVFKRAFYLDIDCGEGKPYPAKQDGLDALVTFCKASRLLPPSIIVDSGNGLHVYWTLDKPVPLDKWQPVANWLKELCNMHGFDPDPSITADAARILRVPGTYNYKSSGAPHEVRVIHERADNCCLDDITRAMYPHHTSSRLGQLIGDDDLALPEPQFEERHRFTKEVIKRCGVMQHTYQSGGKGQSEPLWAQVMNLLAFTEDGADYIHALSDQHADYDKVVAERKFGYALRRKAEKKSGPTLCKTFAGWMPDVCKVCEHMGKIKTPLQLGEDLSSSLPYGFKQDEHGVHRLTVNKKGEQIWVRLVPYQFSNPNLSYDHGAEDGTAEWHFSFDSMLADVATHCTIPISSIQDARTLARYLCRGAVFVEDEHLGGMKKLMAVWAQRMQRAKESKPRYSQLGWVERSKKVGFVLAHQVLWEEGKIETAHPHDSRLASQYREEGAAEIWLALAKQVTKQGRHAINAALATAFAAPLIKFTGVSGAMFSIVSPESGTGKTSVLKLAQAVWGCPRRAIHALDDTPRSIAYKLGYLNNLPSYWDEIRMAEDAQGFIRLMFQLGQGKERSRLTATVAAQAMGTWTTLITAASNEFLTEYVDHIVRSSNAGRARIFEVEVPRYSGDTIPPFAFAKLDENYGAIGRQYAEFLVTNHTEIERFVGALWARLNKQVNMHNDERFWMATIVSTVAGAHFANKLGFTAIDMPGLTRWFMDEFKRLRGETAEVHLDPAAAATNLLLDYVASKRDQLIVCDRASKKGRYGMNVGAIHVQPQRGQILGFIALKDRVMRILINDFADWMRAQRRINNPMALIKALVSAGAATKTRGSVTCGLVNTLNSPAYTLDVQLNSRALRGLLAQTVDSLGDGVSGGAGETD